MVGTLRFALPILRLGRARKGQAGCSMHVSECPGKGGPAMMPTKALIATIVVASVVGLALLIERQAEAPGEVKAEQLLVSDLAGEPDKEVNIQEYTSPAAAS